ncbi:MAG: Mur ligase family protein [Desulfovibrionaceae bacterium]
MRFSSYGEILEHLETLGLFHMDLTLARVQRFANAFGVPGFGLAHVVGTNGKGSTAAFLESLARAHGLRTGLYTSPHFLDVRERILVNGAMLSAEQWLSAANAVMKMVGDAGLTYFEMLTCLAMNAFREAGIELAIMEAGLGGQYDAVRVFDTDIALLTPIGMDHAQILGPELTDIARDKSHVISPGSSALTAPQEREVMDVLQERADHVHATLDVSPGYAGPLSMPGLHQAVNAGLALASWRKLAGRMGLESSPEREAEALFKTFVPGRFQRVKEAGASWILDGAHNEPALHCLGAALQAESVVPDVLVVACMRDKDLDAMTPLFRHLGARRIVCPEMAMHERMLQSRELASRLGSTAECVDGPETAFAKAAELGGTVLVCGSLYLLAEFYRLYSCHLARYSS